MGETRVTLNSTTWSPLVSYGCFLDWLIYRIRSNLQIETHGLKFEKRVSDDLHPLPVLSYIKTTNCEYNDIANNVLRF